MDRELVHVDAYLKSRNFRPAIPSTYDKNYFCWKNKELDLEVFYDNACWSIRWIVKPGLSVVAGKGYKELRGIIENVSH